jgi:single-strand DNA-binding protein
MINRVVLVGRITKDPILRKTQTGKSVASFTVACNRRATTGQKEQADFINCSAWERTAEFMSQYVHKGALIGVEGRITTGSYDGSDGKKVFTTEVAPSQGQSQGYYPDNNTAEEDFNTGPLLDISSDDLPF